MKQLLLFPLYLYWATTHLRNQLLVSFFGFKFSCRHQPTCSQAMRRAIKNRGLLRGTAVGCRQLLTCW